MIDRQKAVQGALNQFHTVFKRMAADGERWHFYEGSAPVLLKQSAKSDAHLPLLVPDVQAMSASQVKGHVLEALSNPEYRAQIIARAGLTGHALGPNTATA